MRRAIEIDPNYALAHFQLGFLSSGGIAMRGSPQASFGHGEGEHSWYMKECASEWERVTPYQ
jgi:hypothetical protein